MHPVWLKYNMLPIILICLTWSVFQITIEIRDPPITVMIENSSHVTWPKFSTFLHMLLFRFLWFPHLVAGEYCWKRMESDPWSVLLSLHHPCVSGIFFVGGLMDYCIQPIWIYDGQKARLVEWVVSDESRILQWLSNLTYLRIFSIFGVGRWPTSLQ